MIKSYIFSKITLLPALVVYTENGCFYGATSHSNVQPCHLNGQFVALHYRVLMISCCEQQYTKTDMHRKTKTKLSLKFVIVCVFSKQAGKGNKLHLKGP